MPPHYKSGLDGVEEHFETESTYKEICCELGQRDIPNMIARTISGFCERLSTVIIRR
jgi:hypothetical protein